ncbi:uncharacterized protein Tco025E_08438 [Trypanosoma conorhini]|uniref:Uncharacterized protein n=1 Tax=Trypanosoma conorhini TaxID=83891 RepID=A0A3R7NFZ1_9TRYP|nr:uncharacterized protein Tco025E_08438 [Trypanosoma conorhini]RNF02135.1 hypothetical protein Tco025E_08438 [Trypanosoma conorhini]
MDDNKNIFAASGRVGCRGQQNQLELFEQIVVVMRHGERRDGAVGAEPEADPPLTESGAAQIAKTAEKLRVMLGEKKAREMLIIVSPFLRTRQTAEVLRQCGIGALEPPLVDNTLCEVYGPLRIKGITAQVLPDAVVKKGSGKLPQWGESIELASERYVENMLRNSHSYPHNNLLLVTHGDAISAIVTALYPTRVVYETEYLSFIALKGGSKSGSGGGTDSYRLFNSSGVRWIEDALSATRHSNESSGEYHRMNFVVNAIDGSRDTTNGSHDVTENASAGTTILFRLMLISSQALTLPLWSHGGSAAIYVGVVIALELVSVAHSLRLLRCVQSDVTSSSVEHIRRLTPRQIAFLGCGISPKLQRCVLSLGMSLVKAVGIFVLCMIVATFATAFSKSQFVVMRESYAAAFASGRKFIVFVLFVVFDTLRRFYEVEHLA